MVSGPNDAQIDFELGLVTPKSITHSFGSTKVKAKSWFVLTQSWMRFKYLLVKHNITIVHADCTVEIYTYTFTLHWQLCMFHDHKWLPHQFISRFKYQLSPCSHVIENFHTFSFILIEFQAHSINLAFVYVRVMIYLVVYLLCPNIRVP